MGRDPINELADVDAVINDGLGIKRHEHSGKISLYMRTLETQPAACGCCSRTSDGWTSVTVDAGEMSDLSYLFDKLNGDEGAAADEPPTLEDEIQVKDVVDEHEYTTTHGQTGVRKRVVLHNTCAECQNRLRAKVEYERNLRFLVSTYCDVCDSDTYIYEYV